MKEKTRAHILVSGLVQGVGFRFFCERTAKELNLQGWVRNVPEGSVEVLIEGDKENVLKMIEYLKQGPAPAQVKDIKIEWQEYKGEFQDFKILF